VAQPLQLPELPPEGPWAAYVLVVIWLPLVLRIILLLFPFRRALVRLAPHTTWAIKQLRDLPIKGIGILALNEIIAFSIPPLIVLGLRGFLDPIGWQTWSDAPNSGIAFLTLAFFVWIFFDFLRIARVRRMMKALEKHDIEKIKKIADAGLKTRKWLRKFSKKEQPDVASITETSTEVATKSAKRWGKRILLTRKITPAGLLSSVALTASVQLARSGAGKLTDAVDARLQREFDNIAKTNTKTLIILLIRDLLMGIIPILILAGLPILFA
jgi:hypothetical protein